jgi:hypothetical protein
VLCCGMRMRLSVSLPSAAKEMWTCVVLVLCAEFVAPSVGCPELWLVLSSFVPSRGFVWQEWPLLASSSALFPSVLGTCAISSRVGGLWQSPLFLACQRGSVTARLLQSG